MAPSASSKHAQNSAVFTTNDEAAANVQGMLWGALGLVLAIVGVIITASILASLIGDYASNVRSVSENVSTQDWGDPTANTLAGPFALLLSLGGLFGIVGVAIASFVFSRR